MLVAYTLRATVSTLSASSEVSRPSRFWRWLTAFTIAGTVALNYYANSRPFNGQTMGEVSAKYATLLTPASFTFSIWGVIFLGLLIYAVWQLLPGQRQQALPDAVARPLTLATVGAGVWVVLFAYEQIGLSVFTMLVTLSALALAYGRAREIVRADAVPHWVSIPLALFLGWVSVAAILNLTIGLRQLTGAIDAQLEIYLTTTLLFLMVGLGLILSAIFRERTFSLVLAWALAGIWLAQVREIPDLAWTALGLAALVLLAGLVLAQRGRKLFPYQVAQAAVERAARAKKPKPAATGTSS